MVVNHSTGTAARALYAHSNSTIYAFYMDSTSHGNDATVALYGGHIHGRHSTWQGDYGSLGEVGAQSSAVYTNASYPTGSSSTVQADADGYSVQ